jgi:hypothetical protein
MLADKRNKITRVELPDDKMDVTNKLIEQNEKLLQARNMASDAQMQSFEIIGNMNENNTKIDKSRDKLKEMSGELVHSNSVISRMTKRENIMKFLGTLGIILIVCTLLVVAYIKIAK